MRHGDLYTEQLRQQLREAGKDIAHHWDEVSKAFTRQIINELIAKRAAEEEVNAKQKMGDS